MKKYLLVLLIISFHLKLFSNENSIKVILNELNTDKVVEINLINKQVLFIKPNGLLKIPKLPEQYTLSVFSNNKDFPFINKDDDIIIKAPATSNTEFQVYINSKTSIHLSFSVVTAIEDKDVNDGFIIFNKIKYTIGFYRKIPVVPGKVNYFKKDYAPPKWFILWNEAFINRPISKRLKYGDLVTMPKPFDKKSKRPTKIFTCCYKIMKEFDLLIDKAREKIVFEKVRVLSFYRTPNYNKSLGTSGFSRHLYGDAIDFFIDEKKPFMVMDDLNHDKKKTVSDAKPFFIAYKQLITSHVNPPGGMGVYFSKKGASIHYDSRGHLARWGAVDRWWPVKSLPKELKDLEDKIKLLKEQYEKKRPKPKKKKK